MGTRADFYIGRGESAEWLGSIAWDGYPDGITPKSEETEMYFGSTHHKDAAWPIGESLFAANTEAEFRSRLAHFFRYRDDVTLPADGWPWPWEDSRTTDYAYAFDGGKVWASCFGHTWFDPTVERTEDDYAEVEGEQKVMFPRMDKTKSARAGSKRSGVMVFTAPGS